MMNKLQFFRVCIVQPVLPMGEQLSDRLNDQSSESPVIGTGDALTSPGINAIRSMVESSLVDVNSSRHECAPNFAPDRPKTPRTFAIYQVCGVFFLFAGIGGLAMIKDPTRTGVCFVTPRTSRPGTVGDGLVTPVVL
jgi:hypothetical protein